MPTQTACQLKNGHLFWFDMSSGLFSISSTCDHTYIKWTHTFVIFSFTVTQTEVMPKQQSRYLLPPPQWLLVLIHLESLRRSILSSSSPVITAVFVSGWQPFCRCDKRHGQQCNETWRESRDVWRKCLWRKQYQSQSASHFCLCVCYINAMQENISKG